MPGAIEVQPQHTGLVDPAWALLRVAALVGLAYYAGARIGMALALPSLPASLLWPPHAVLLAALVLTPRRWCWAALAGALPAHLLVQPHAGVPPSAVLGAFASSAAGSVAGALLFRQFADARGLRTLRAVMAFCAAAVTTPFLASLLDAVILQVAGAGRADFGTVWQVRFFSGVLACVTFVPVVLAWSDAEPVPLRQERRAQLFEIAALVACLFGTSVVVFDSGVAASASPPVLLYLPVPFLLWAALRSGPALTSAAYAIIAFLVIWGAAHGRGPFHTQSAGLEALPIQLFLVSLAVPLLMLAAVIEERRASERRLRASEDLFATAFREGPLAIAISRQSDGRIVEANARWLQVMGLAPDTRAEDIAPLGEHLDEAGRRRMSALAADPRPGQDVELAVRDRDGHLHAVVAAVASVEVAGEPCRITILRDITQQRHAEKDAREQRRQLTHLSRVASLSDFSSTIAHELNQPLTAILANAQAALRFLQRSPPNVGEIRVILDEIADADKRAGLLIHHLRLLMKKGQEELAPLELSHLVHDVLDFVRGEFVMRGVQVKTTFARDLPAVLGDRVQLQQVLLNLVINACDAMQEQYGPRDLTVSTSQTVDGHVQVLVSDTGPGIPPEQLERVFEPFYTTKESGIGMGLAICRRIADAHGGTLTVQSRPGEGASFRLVLPAADAARAGYKGSTPTATAS